MKEEFLFFSKINQEVAILCDRKDIPVFDPSIPLNISHDIDVCKVLAYSKYNLELASVLNLIWRYLVLYSMHPYI